MSDINEIKYRRGKFSIDRYEFVNGGEGDVLVLDLVNDPSQGLGVPAQSLLIMNHGGGAGNNYLYYRTSVDGDGWDKLVTILPDRTEEYEPADGQVISQLMLWASNANLQVSVRATPGEWTLKKLRLYVPSPAPSVDAKLLGIEDKWAALQTGV